MNLPIDPKENPKKDIQAILRRIAESGPPPRSNGEWNSDMPQLHGEQEQSIGSKLWSGVKYLFAGDKWRQDRSERLARALQASRERHADALQQRQMMFGELQRLDNQLFQADENQKNRELQAYLAEAHRLMIQEEGERNREMARELAELQSEVQREEGQLNREHSLKLELMRAEIGKWVEERNREVALELREIDAKVQLDLRLEDRKTARATIERNKQLSNSPLCALAEDLLSGAVPAQGAVTPLLILPAPPTLKFDEKGGGTTLGNSPLAQHFPLIEKELGAALAPAAAAVARMVQGRAAGQPGGVHRLVGGNVSSHVRRAGRGAARLPACRVVFGIRRQPGGIAG